MNQMKSTTSEVCELGIVERPRYYPRQLITPVEMTLEQTYFRDKLRRHNRLFHGWGVLCGAEVCAVRNSTGDGWESWKVRVRSGYALAPIGEEIVISKERILDLRVTSAIGGPEDLSSEIIDPWCRPVYQDNLPEWVYVAVRYRETMTRPVRAQPVGCGYSDTSCEYSRICDGYEFGILSNCPDSHQNPPQFPDVAALLSAGTGTCLECPEDEWVVLAAVRLEKTGRILAIDNCSCRRIVASFAAVWTKCTSAGLTITKIDPAEMEQDGTYDVVIGGSNFQSGATVELGNWAKITDLDVKTSEIRFHIVISKEAPLGNQTLMVMNPDCSLVVTTMQIKAKQTETTQEKNANPLDKDKLKKARKR
jgi:hypothetical protein